MARTGPRMDSGTAIADQASVAPASGEHHRARRRDESRHRLFSILSTLTLFLIDATALVIAFTSAYRLRDIARMLGPAGSPSRGTYLLLVGLATTTILVVFVVSGLYRGRRTVSRMDESYRIVTHVSLGLVIAIAVSALILGEEFIFSRQMMVFGWIFAIVGVSAGRFIHTGIVGSLRARGVAADRVLIVGAARTGQLVLDKIRRSPQLGFDVVGFVRHRPWPEGDVQSSLDGVPVVGMTNELAEIVEDLEVDEIVIALSGVPHDEIMDMVFAVTNLPVAIRVYPETFRLLTSDVLSISDLNGLPTVSVRTIGLRPVERVMKRIMDVIISVTMLVLFSPLMFLIALLVKLSSPGPVFYTQERVGRDGRSFLVLKFRSMPVDAEQRTGPVFTSADDPRPGRLGRFLRRYSLDELPQFINVLFGEMSVVGPRPERPYFVEQFRQTIPAYMARHHEKAGITGWAQVNGLRGDTSVEERTLYDLYYVENWSILFDLKIMVKTLFHIFRQDNNAY
ncbi:MAG TPA: undecaprenyl-phosphate glucose phosphotransferase [Thermomicrobiales bacterium]|nr:undecaprenyl-phosphate glucose phosphotransferase [Thermomicrobiales bacterium]